MPTYETTLYLDDMTKILKAPEQEAQSRPAALLVISGELNGTIIDLQQPMIQAGRGIDNTIHLNFTAISRYHFRLKAHENTHLLEDCGSTNGTFLNDAKLQGSAPLKKGDIIKVGTLAFKYIPKGDPERLAYDKLSLDANLDTHTGCYNKTFFNKSLTHLVNQAKLNNQTLSLIVIDLDHFKQINDTFGHDAGDFILKEIAQLIRESGIRTGDIFARYGGEEFVILLPKTILKQAVVIAERVRQLIASRTFEYNTQKLTITASMGVTEYNKEMFTGTDLFKKADELVYLSKKQGRNRITSA